MIPKCVECLRKHLSSALSLGVEVMNGHSAGGNPDHRVDFSGELTESEKHANLLDKSLSLKIRHLRRTLQGQRWKPAAADLDSIRVFWHASYAIGGEQELYGIKVSDQELYSSITESLKKYEKLPSAEDQANIVTECKCKGDAKAKRPVVNYGNRVSILYCSDEDKIPQKIAASMSAFVDGLDSRTIVPLEFEKWPKSFIEKNWSLFEEVEGNLLCLWPKGVEIIRRTNPLAIPSIISDVRSLSDSDESYLKLKENGLTSYNSFAKIPIYVEAGMLIGLCESYQKLTGSTEIGDLYSLIRNFDHSVFFTNTNSLVVKSAEKPSEKTLFIVP